MFERIHNEFTLPAEGGAKVSNNPKDPGGYTKYGISFRFLQNIPVKDADINKDGIVTWQDVLALDEAKQKVIFKKYFWDTIKGDEMPSLLAMAVYDAAVNLGVVRAIKMLQYALGVTSDGVIGVQTLAAANSKDTVNTVKIIMAVRMLYYYGLANDTAWADEFIQGWRNRVYKLYTFLGIENYFN